MCVFFVTLMWAPLACIDGISYLGRVVALRCPRQFNSAAFVFIMFRMTALGDVETGVLDMDVNYFMSTLSQVFFYSVALSHDQPHIEACRKGSMQTLRRVCIRA